MTTLEEYPTESTARSFEVTNDFVKERHNMGRVNSPTTSVTIDEERSTSTAASTNSTPLQDESNDTSKKEAYAEEALEILIQHPPSMTRETDTSAERETIVVSPVNVVRESLIPSEYDAFVEGHSFVEDSECEDLSKLNDEFEYSITDFQEKQSFDQVEAARAFTKRMQSPDALNEQPDISNGDIASADNEEEHDHQPQQCNSSVSSNNDGTSQEHSLPDEEEEEVFWDEDANQEVRLKDPNDNSSYSASAFSPWSDNTDGEDETTTTTMDGLFSQDAMSSFCSSQEQLSQEQRSVSTHDEMQRLRNCHSADETQYVQTTHSLENMPDAYPFSSPLGLESKSYDTCEQYNTQQQNEISSPVHHPPYVRRAEKQKQQQRAEKQRRKRASSRRPDPALNNQPKQQQQSKPRKDRSRSRRPSSSATGKTSSIPQESPLSSTNSKYISPRNAFARVFTSRPLLFRRNTTTSKTSSSLEPTPENAAMEVSEQPTTTTTTTSSSGGPIDYIQTSSSSSHQPDLVSQITMQKDDFLQVPRNKEEEDKLWGWSTTRNPMNAIQADGQQWLPTIVQDMAQNYLYPDDPVRDFMGSDDDDDDESDPFENLPEDKEPENSNSEEVSDVGLNSINFMAGDNTDLSAYRNNQEPSPTHSHVEDIVHEVHTDRWMTKPAATKASQTSSQKKKKNPKLQSQIAQLQRTLEEQTIELGRYHPKVATSLVALGVLRLSHEEYDLAIDAILEGLRIQKARRDPRGMARSLHILSEVYVQQEHWDWAISCLTDVQHIERRLYGPDHVETAHTLNRLGHVHAQRHEFDEAMEKHLKALQVLKLSVGEDPNHPFVCQTLIKIGDIYYQERNSLDNIVSSSSNNSFEFLPMIEVIARAHEARGNYKQALGFFEEKLQLLPQPDAPLLLSLGTMSCKCGQFMEAIDYYEQALEVTNEEAHAAMANVLVGTVEYHLGNYAQAWTLLEKAMKTLEPECGSNSEVVADIMYRQGWVQLSLEQYEGAKTTWLIAFQIQVDLFGPQDLAALQTRLALYELELMQDSFTEESYERMVSEITTIQNQQQETLGQTSHPLLAETILLLANVHLSYSFAFPNNVATKAGIRLLRQSFHMREQFLGRDHPLQATTFYWLAIAGIRLFQKHKTGIPMLQSVLRVWKETVGENHTNVALAYHMLGRCCAALGQMEAANSWLDHAWKIVNQQNCSRTIAEVLVSRGMVQLKQCHFQVARESLQTALSIYEKRLGMASNHYLVKEAKDSLERVERDEMLCV